MDDAGRGPNPHLVEALKLARRFEAGKRREMARFICDNLCYFAYWHERGSNELLQLSVLALEGRTVSRRDHAEPEAVYLVRVWASDRLGLARSGSKDLCRDENERLLRRFVYRNLPRNEVDEISAHDWNP